MKTNHRRLLGVPQKSFFIGAAVVHLLIPSAHAVVPADSTVWRLVQQGKTQLAANKLKDAEQSFRKALQKNRDLTAAMAGLGEVFLAKKDWGEANDWYDKILDREPENLEAMYYRGICYRECGVPKAMILRKLDWDNAAKHFKKVLARDSSFYDTLFQYAKLRRYQENYAEAIELGHRQVRLRPEQVESQLGLFRLYQHFLDNKGASEVTAWLRENDSEHARYFIGEVYRRDNKLVAADSIFLQLLAAAPTASLIPLHLSLARLHFQRRENNEAEQNFWRAVDGIRHRLDAELVFEDIKYLVSETELQQFRRLVAAQDYMDFFYRFWTSRDPTPAAPNNARLAEHYRRMHIAEKDYVYDGFRTWFNNPDKLGYQKFPPAFYLNDRFNDRGLIFIRQGDPDERLVTTALTVESWRYKPRENAPEMIFHFMVDENGVGNNWRLTPFVNDPQFWSDRVNFGNAYSRMIFGDVMERLALIEEVGQQSRVAVDTGFRFDRHTWDKSVQPLNATAYAAFFKGPNNESYFDLYYSLPLPSMKDLARAGNNGPTLCEHGVALHDMNWRPVEQRHDLITKEQIPDFANMPSLIGQYHFAVQPDSYHVAFFVRQPATNRLGGWKDEMRIPRFDGGGLAMSSLVLASSITPASDGEVFTKNGLRIIPVPSKRFARQQPVYVYFEVYNLVPDAAGKSSFVAEYTTTLRKEKKSGAKKVFSVLGSKTKPATTLAMERDANGTTSTEYLALDLNKAGAGDFRLSVRIKDKKSGRESEGFIDLTLVDMKNKKL
jgi:tetratricopeptide (TPR) repeat protein